MAYNMQTYVAEVLHRLDSYQVQINIDPITAAMLVNAARADVQMLSEGLVPECYSRRFRIWEAPVLDEDLLVGLSDSFHGVRVVRYWRWRLPAAFRSDVAVRVRHGELWAQARPTTRREVFEASTRSFANPTWISPVYLLTKSTTESSPYISVSIGEGILAPGDVEVWFQSQVTPLSLTSPGPDMEAKIPPDLQELVVSIACLKAMAIIDPTKVGEVLEFEVMSAIRVIEGNYATEIDRGRLLTQAQESLVPNKPTEVIPGP